VAFRPQKFPWLQACGDLAECAAQIGADSPHHNEGGHAINAAIRPYSIAVTPRVSLVREGLKYCTGSSRLGDFPGKVHREYC